MNINYEYYRVFYYVAVYKSFTKAALILHNNQPNITHTINRLESELNCKLFIRNTRGVKLTPDGEALFLHVKIAVEQFQQGEEKITQNSGLEHGSISISASETALNVYLLTRLKDFHMDSPGIRLRISNHSTPQAVSAVKNGEVDFAVVTTPAVIEPPLKKIILSDFREILIGGRNFTALSSQDLTLSELQNYPFISLGRNTMTYNFYNEWFLENHLKFHPDTEVATTDQILSLVKHELGLGFLPEPMAEASLRHKEIVSIRLRESVPLRHVCLIYDPKRPLSRAAQELKQLILADASHRNSVN